MTWTIRIPKWGEFQHYKHRSPPWIKLYVRHLDKRAWRDLPASAAKLLVDLWMLAACYHDGEITLPAKDIAWRLRIPVDQMAADLQALESVALVELASDVLAACQQGATPEESRGETEESKRIPPTADELPKEWPRVLGKLWRETYHGDPNYGLLGKHLKPLVAEHGLAAVRQRFIAYIRATPKEYVSLPKFVQTFGSWGTKAKDNYLTPDQVS